MVLYGTADNFSCRGGEFVYENHNATFFLHASEAFCYELLARHDTTFGVDNHRAFRKKLAGHFLCCIEVTASVEFQVENQVLHARFLEHLNFIVNLFAGSGTEAVEVNVACGRCNHVGGIDRVDGDFVTRNLEVKYFVGTSSHDVKVGNCTLRTTQTGHDAVAIHLDAGNLGAVYRNDAIAR